MTKNKSQSGSQALPDPIVVDCTSGDLNVLLSKEWLLTNSIGAYASSTPVGCNARRYHALLVAATLPPVGRMTCLSMVMEQLTVGGATYELATNEFSNAISPRGIVHLAEFRNDIAPTFIYRIGDVELKKEIMLADAANAVTVRYTLSGPAEAKLCVWPFTAMRDFHALRKAHEPHQLTFELQGETLAVHDRMQQQHALLINAGGAPFEPKPQWWYRFCYRTDIARGQDGFEDLYTPGNFTWQLSPGQSVQITASLEEPIAIDFDSTVKRRRSRLAGLVQAVGCDEPAVGRLAMATDTFIAHRSMPGSPPLATILAGYHWFADWGRDTFIALPGLLLSTKQFDLAKSVFKTFAGSIANGMVPNRFDDYSASAHYNSIDASLWFIIAAERYVAASGDTKFWRDVLMPAADTILKAYQNGTLFDIHADADGLLVGGSQQTQLTWMDAKLGNEVITPRQGKAVEVNAMWHCAHRIMADRCRGIDNRLAAHYAQQADLIGPAFVRVFWNEPLGWLYDCISDSWPDASLRPNQILAVSLPHSPLSKAQQQSVVQIVTEKLLTPCGLRTLSPDDGRYRRRYGGSWESRDRAYHQGTVWAWLIGPFIEAYLKVEQGKPFAVAKAKEWLAGFDGHLLEAGLGQISEIFDGDYPHNPNGCIAQAWSVGEVLRAKLMVAEMEARP